ncbi:hypothetical protein E2C01_016658 [Portunus trituberculatus]|uniref:Uncharacterized protein n=1 Tax=Portunus trituberculatus TaxID=210409 RepID=A0A5B7DPM3_PORTR|nr:hypothetical protein [Portunus trituberculatus]
MQYILPIHPHSSKKQEDWATHFLPLSDKSHAWQPSPPPFVTQLPATRAKIRLPQCLLYGSVSSFSRRIVNLTAVGGEEECSLESPLSPMYSHHHRRRSSLYKLRWGHGTR